MPIAIVTGSDSGIGRATAVALARDGFDVGVTWHEDEAGAEATAAEVRELGRRAEVRRLDLSAAENGPPVVDALADALGGLDVLVNNSGTGDLSPVLEVELATWRHVLEVDLTGAFLCAQAAARRMVAAGGGGRIVNVTSVHEHIPLAGSAPYCAAKGGLGLLTKVMALELAEHGITVNAVAPGEIATPMTGNEVGQMLYDLVEAKRRDIAEAEAEQTKASPGGLRARILWPALGFPAVIAPRKGRTGRQDRHRRRAAGPDARRRHGASRGLEAAVRRRRHAADREDRRR